MPKVFYELQETTMKKLEEINALNVNDDVVKKFIDDAHECAIKQRNRVIGEGYVLENRIFENFISDPRMSAEDCSEKLNAEYGTSIQGHFIIRLFNNLFGRDSRRRREEAFKWASDLATVFVKTLMSRTAKDYEDYLKRLPRNPRDRNDFEKRQANFKRRILALTLYIKYPKLNVYNEIESIEKLGYPYAAQFLYDINDLLRIICGVQEKDRSKNPAQREIERLRGALENNEILLKDLQEDFEARLQANHQNEMIDFFSGLNAEKYGRILDELLNIRSGIQQLRKQNTDLPPEISGLFIFINNFSKFVKDNEITPIMKIGSVHEMTFNEIQSCDYEGSPYVKSDEVKRVKVLSPGWFYKNKEIQIARPRLRELSDENE